MIYCYTALLAVGTTLGLARGSFYLPLFLPSMAFVALGWSISYFAGLLARQDSTCLSRRIQEAINPHGA